MNLQHKHWALITIGALVVIFLAIAAWFLYAAHIQPPAQQAVVATSTIPSVAKLSGPAHITENAQYYDIDLTYPSATPLASISLAANADAVAAMKAAMQQIADEFKKNGDFANLTAEDVQMMGLGSRQEAVDSKYETYHGARTVSYVFQIYEDTMGAHPNTYYRAFTFDTRTGEQLPLGKLFTDENGYTQVMSMLARQELPKIIAKLEAANENEVDIDTINLGTEPKAENFENYYISGSALTVVFAPYQVGPYAMGTVIMPVPLSQLSTSLKAEYR